MIYLFDDSVVQGINPLDFTDCLCLVKTLSIEQMERMEAAIANADCIMVHKSFRDEGGHTANVRERLTEDISEFGDTIPLVLFSDGDMAGRPEVENDRFVSAIKKSEFYLRLPAFLEHYRSTNKIEMALLVTGKSLDVVSAISLGKAILDNVTLRFMEDQEMVPSAVLSLPEFGRLLNVANPEAQISFDAIASQIKEGRISMAQLRSNIRNTITDFTVYGRNLHRWE